ncbi:MAG: peptide ABC transporter substrate-binding protein [Anaerolineaceae bacterium]|jgi:peptide/nickel transport system substrate-binding protein|nr:peptide ABC transporter substrate-binding protein [Anaerolineaceae bacterium]
MKKLRWQLIIIFLTGLVVGILLLGEQPAVQTLAPAPVQGGVYTEALIGAPQRFNPLLDYYNAVDRDVDALVYSGLVKFDSRGVPHPELAESWGISQDGMTYNFALRPGITWHDGEPFTTDDVLFTIEMMREGEGLVPTDITVFWQEVEVKVFSDLSLQFVLPEPFAPFLDYLTFGVLPQHILGDRSFAEMVDDDYNLSPVGTGPYRFDRVVVENGQISGVLLSVNTEYYRDPAYIEQIVLNFYPDARAALEAYRQGVVQGVGLISLDILEEALAEPNLAMYAMRKPELTMVIFNLNNPEVEFLQEVDVRRALLAGLNRQWMINTILRGQGIIADGPILPDTWAYYPKTERVAFDRDTAIKLLREAEYVVAGEENPVRTKEEVALRFELLYPDTEMHARLAEAIQTNWAELDVDVSITPVPYEELVNVYLKDRRFQAVLIDLNLTRTPDPDPYPFWDQAMATGGQNYSQWDNRIASEYIEQARVVADLGERERLYRNFQVIFGEELPALPLYYPIYNYGVAYDVQGVSVGPLYDNSDRFNTVTEWFLVAKRTLQDAPVVVEPTPEP